MPVLSQRTWIVIAAVAAALVAAWFVFGAQAYAADLGGKNGVGDLEERVAELEATVARKGNRKVSLTVHGQVNKAILYYDVDNAGFSDTVIVENGSSETGFGITGRARIAPKFDAGYTLEIGQGTTSLNFDFPGGVGIVSDNDIYTRRSFVFLSHEDFGAVSLGLQSMATDDMVHDGVANTTAAEKRLTLQPIGGVSLSFLGNTVFRLEVEPFNGHKADAIRYATPIWSGLQGVVALETGTDSWDAALKYAGEQGGFKFNAGLGYEVDKADDLFFGLVETKTITVNGGMKHIGTGLFAQGTWARLEIGDVETEAYHLQAGFERKLVDWGTTTLWGSYADWEDANISFYGVGVNQNVGDAVDIYLLARKYELGDIDATTIMGGTRIQF